MPAFALRFAPGCLTAFPSQLKQTLPYHLLKEQIHSFGVTLEPRYIVGAEPLDQ